MVDCFQPIKDSCRGVMLELILEGAEQIQDYICEQDRKGWHPWSSVQSIYGIISHIIDIFCISKMREIIHLITSVCLSVSALAAKQG